MRVSQETAERARKEVEERVVAKEGDEKAIVVEAEAKAKVEAEDAIRKAA